MPPLSVIIPTYNCAKYLPQAIESVLNQTYQDFEIIVVDDGSTDDTKSILAQFKDKVRYFYKENNGSASARNLGVRQTRGQYIAFIDADDVWLPDKLSAQMGVMEKYPDAAMVFTDGDWLNEAGSERTNFRAFEFLFEEEGDFKEQAAGLRLNDGRAIKGDFYKHLLKANLVLCTSVLMRKKCFQAAGGFDEKFYKAQDYELWLRVCLKYEVVYLNKITVGYRIRNSSVSGRREDRFFLYKESDAKVLSSHLKYCRPHDRKYIKARIAESYQIAAWRYLQEAKYDKARELSLRSLAFNPSNFKLVFYVFYTFLPEFCKRFVGRLRKYA